MAIGYLTNIDLNNNQVKDFKIDNVTSDPTGLAGEGQMIYRTDTNQMKYHTGSNNWVAFGTSGGTVTSVNLGSSTSTISVSDRKSTRLNSSHGYISYAVFCLKKKKKTTH